MIHRCETCPFWQPYLKTPSFGGFGVCNKAATSREDANDPDDNKTLAQAFGEGPEAQGGRLETYVAFGCVMHPMNKAVA